MQIYKKIQTYANFKVKKCKKVLKKYKKEGVNTFFGANSYIIPLLFVPLLLMNKNRRYRDTVATTTLPDGTTKTKLFPSLKESLQMLVTFVLVVFGWIIFRATGMNTLTLWVSRIFDNSFFTVPWLMNKYFYPTLFMNIILLLIIEWINRESNHGLEITNIKWRWLRWLIYLVIIFMAFFTANVDNAQFIYFQF